MFWGYGPINWTQQVDGAILPVANVSRARTQKIKRFSDKKYWTKIDRKLYIIHHRRRIKFEKLCYGVLVMVLCMMCGLCMVACMKAGRIGRGRK